MYCITNNLIKLQSSQRIICKNQELLRGFTVFNHTETNIEKPGAHYRTNRFKSKTSKKGVSKYASSTETASSDEQVDKHTKIMNINVTSPRVDVILKSGLGIARNKIETMFYESKIRVNGEKPLKKSVQVKEGDEIDIIKGPSPTNPDMLLVARLEVVSFKPREESIVVKVRRLKTLLIENYGHKQVD